MTRSEGPPEQLRLLAAAAHDLKTPLVFIKGAAQQWGSTGLNPAQRIELIRRVGQSADRMLKLIDSLIGSAQAEQTPLLLEPVAAGDVIWQAHQDIKPYADELGFDFHIRLARGLPPVLTHRLSLRRILFNLMDNAIKYSRRERRVNITAGKGADEQVIISVRDYGIGINQADMKQIFTLYGQAAEPTNALPGSSGLGLFIASTLAEAASAHLSVRPHKLGTTFRVDVPAARQLSLFA